MGEKKKIIIRIKKKVLVENQDIEPTPEPVIVEPAAIVEKKARKKKPVAVETAASAEIEPIKEHSAKKRTTKSKVEVEGGVDEELKDTDFDGLQKKVYDLPAFDIAGHLVREMTLQRWQVENTMQLLDEENTVPFISRYRKEKTGELDEVQIREIEKGMQYLRTLHARKKEVLSSILTQGKLTEELEKKILTVMKLSDVEELYLPYKPKKKTRATKAKERGLEPLAEHMRREEHPETFASAFINSKLGVKTAQDALDGAMDIIAEEFAEHFEIRKLCRSTIIQTGTFDVKKKNPAESDEFDMYKEYSEEIRSIKNHRILAINRGESRDKLSVHVEADDEMLTDLLIGNLIKLTGYVRNGCLDDACKDGYKRLLFPSMVTDIRNELTEKAENEAIEIFARNLKALLLTPPLKNRRILAIDPGIRTGSKIAVIDEFGKYLDDTKFFQEQREDEAKDIIERYVCKYAIELIAIGNGTASRDVEKLVAATIKERELDCKYLLVSETGASVYSASDTARAEFPSLDVTVRGAISIGRRVLDPLAEFVKIDPKSLGVGQYQHDVNQKTLSGKLDEVVEDTVNHVGVILNTASAQLLRYVSGISERVAKNIVAYREEKGPFHARKELLNVSGLGEKIFTQAAGFLRIPESKNPLDNSWIHPESYSIAEELMALQKEGKTINDDLKKTIAAKYGKGAVTVNDIVDDLKKPGRDPREEIEPPILKDEILSIDDLQIGMALKGTVRNVTNFGAFVDIGIKNDGLVHISELSDTFVEDPLTKVHVGQIVDVRVIGVDRDRSRVSLSMKTGERKEAPRPGSGQGETGKPGRPSGHPSDNRQGTGGRSPERRKQADEPVTLGDLFKNLKK